MGSRLMRHEAGIALVTVIIMALICMIVGIAYVTTVFRNKEKQAGFSNSVAGYYAAEAGINRGAGDTRNAFLNYQVPSTCTPQSFSLNGRTVTYTLTGCGQTPVTFQVPAGDPFAGLNAQLFVYDLNSNAVNAQGFTEALLKMRFEVRLIPMFQMVAFYKNDLEVLPGPAAVINGRLHTNGDMYMEDGTCEGLQVQGRVTAVGNLYRGPKDARAYPAGTVWIAKASGAMQILGRTAPGDASCGTGPGARLISSSEAATWGGTIQTNLQNINLPGEDTLLCAPWSCPPGQNPGSYWQNAQLRIALNITRTEQLVSGGPGPSLYALEVYSADGTVNSAMTTRLKQFAQQVPGGITYTDVPTTSACTWGTSCQSNYSSSSNYGTPFPTPGVNGCTVTRNPYDVISTTNFCNDFRYGGFYNWREQKPFLMLNVDWRKLEEWNFGQPPPSRLYDPNTTTNGGLVLYATVRGNNSGYSGNSSIPNNYGVRILNAQRVRFRGSDPGITFASDQRVYILGNFNCRAPGIVSDSVPASCGANGKRPASVVGDTMNILSCAWVTNVSMGAGGGSSACQSSINPGASEPPGNVWRPMDELSTTGSLSTAQQTFINAAYLAANDTTACPTDPTGRTCSYPNWYSGGLENYQRFMEDWTSIKIWYQGSFVGIDTPKHTCYTYNAGLTTVDDSAFSCHSYQYSSQWLQGYWGNLGDVYYVPPTRRFFYDTSFNNAANLPPLTPRFVVVRQRFLTQVYQ